VLGRQVADGEGTFELRLIDAQFISFGDVASLAVGVARCVGEHRIGRLGLACLGETPKTPRCPQLDRVEPSSYPLRRIEQLGRLIARHRVRVSRTESGPRRSSAVRNHQLSSDL